MNTTKNTAVMRIADKIDLAIDFLTLGQYGLEQVPAGDAGAEGCGLWADWEALQPARRRGCEGLLRPVGPHTLA